MKRILIVDDEKDIRNNIKAILQDENYLTDTADSSDDALDLVGQHSYDLIILDYRYIFDLTLYL